MAVTLTAPGVYVDEKSSLSLSISAAATAVPLFTFPAFSPWDFTGSDIEPDRNPVQKQLYDDLLKAVNSMNQQRKLSDSEVDAKLSKMDAKWEANAVDFFASCLAEKISSDLDPAVAPLLDSIVNVGDFIYFKVSSWMDYLEKIAPYLIPAKYALGNSLAVKAGHLDKTEFNNNRTKYYALLKGLGYYAMQHYFLNGGGTCHLALLNSATPDKVTATDYTPLHNYIAGHADITLFCPVTATDDKIISLVMGTPALRIFSLAAAINSSNSITTPAVSETSQAAAYYPWVNISIPFLEGFVAEDFTLYDPEAKDAAYSNTVPANAALKDGGKTGNKGTSTKTTQDDTKAEETFNFKKYGSLDDGLKQELDDLLKQPRLTMPLSPVPAVAGAYCRIDNTRGVWKAPANTPLNGVESLCDSSGNPVAMNDDLNKTLMDNRINAIRHFTDQGHLIWGARTLVPVTDLNWRYVPVRRLFNSAENDIREAMQVAVFEPNAPATWEVVRAAIDNYLHKLWQQGALLGATPAEAYFVRVGLNVTMTAEDINNGVMTVKVGLAAVRPAEFIILEFSQKQM